MSQQAMEWAWAAATKSTGHKVVLVALADHHNGKTKRCDPSVKRLSERTGLSDPRVRVIIRELEEVGLLKREERSGEEGQTTNQIHLACDGPFQGPPLVVENKGGSSPTTTTPPVADNNQTGSSLTGKRTGGLDYPVADGRVIDLAETLEMRRQSRTCRAGVAE